MCKTEKTHTGNGQPHVKTNKWFHEVCKSYQGGNTSLKFCFIPGSFAEKQRFQTASLGHHPQVLLLCLGGVLAQFEFQLKFVYSTSRLVGLGVPFALPQDNWDFRVTHPPLGKI